MAPGPPGDEPGHRAEGRGPGARSPSRPAAGREARGVAGVARWPWALASVIHGLGLGALYIHLPPNPDQSVFDYIGWICARGGLPYRDAADVNFPGPIALHTLAQLAFGNRLWSYRALDYLGLVGFCLFVRSALRRRGATIQADLFAPLYLTMYVVGGYWFAGQRDVIAAHFALVAGFLLLRRVEGGRAGWLIAVGAAAWAAAMLKPTMALILPALFLVDLGIGRRPGRTIVRILADQAAIALAVAALCGLLGWWAHRAGILDDWYELSILLNAEVYAIGTAGRWAVLGGLGGIVRHAWHWYTAAAVAGGLLWWRSGDRPALMVTLAGLGASVGSAVAQGKGFFYHYGGVLTALGLLAAFALARCVEALLDPRNRPIARLAAALPLAIAALGLASKLDGQYRRQVEWRLGRLTHDDYLGNYGLRGPVEVARYVQEFTNERDTILVYSRNFDLSINTASGRRSPVRFAPTLLLDIGGPPFSRAEAWQAEFRAALRDRPPEFIVVGRSEPADRSAGTSGLGAGGTPASRHLDELLAGRYSAVLRREDPTGIVYTCYRRDRPGPSRAGRPSADRERPAGPPTDRDEARPGRG